jgi:hypothetical protein
MHVTEQSTNLESVPVTNQSLTTLDSHATESSACSIINSRDNNKRATLTSGKKQEQQHGNLDEEVGST